VAVHGRPRLPSTGIHWRPGVVVTAQHALERDDEIPLTLPDGRTAPATVAGRDPGTDLAVLKVEAGSTATAEVGDADRLRVGHLVLALGRAGDGTAGASLGVVSALGGPWRTWRGGQVDRLVRLDLALYPGFSGGPLVDAGGRVIGMNSAALARQASVTLPAATVARVADQLLARGRVARGYLGVGLQPVRLPEAQAAGLGLASGAGFVIVGMEPGGPAERAGLLVGDVLVAVDGRPLASLDDLQAAIGGERVGQAARLSLVRGGAAAELAVVVGERPGV
jgi:S1-C subfamily serine protease